MQEAVYTTHANNLSGCYEERWHDAEYRERVLQVIRRVEAEPSLLGASAHLMTVARKATAG